MRRFPLILLAAILLLSVGCGRKEPVLSGTIILKDAMEREVTFRHPPQRIISLAPNITEILYAIGAGERVVGVTRFCNYPPQAAQNAQVGGFTDINMEVILNLKPDLLIGTRGNPQALLNRFEDLGLALFTVEPTTVGEVIVGVELLGRVTGARGRAAEVARGLGTRLKEIEEVVSRAEVKPRIYFGSWEPPYYTCGPGSFQQEMIERAGGMNITGDASSRWPQYSLEKIVEHDPEVIIHGLSGNRIPDIPAVVARLQESPGWRHVTAVKNGRVYVIDDDLTHRPGPRLVDGIETIARLLHPDLFPEVSQ